MAKKNSTKNYGSPAPPNDGQSRDARALEFPDWSGMGPHHNRMSFEQAVEWNDEILALFPPKLNRPAHDAEAKCDVEFVL